MRSQYTSARIITTPIKMAVYDLIFALIEFAFTRVFYWDLNELA